MPQALRYGDKVGNGLQYEHHLARLALHGHDYDDTSSTEMEKCCALIWAGPGKVPVLRTAALSVSSDLSIGCLDRLA